MNAPRGYDITKTKQRTTTNHEHILRGYVHHRVTMQAEEYIPICVFYTHGMSSSLKVVY